MSTIGPFTSSRYATFDAMQFSPCCRFEQCHLTILTFTANKYLLIHISWMYLTCFLSAPVTVGHGIGSRALSLYDSHVIHGCNLGSCDGTPSPLTQIPSPPFPLPSPSLVVNHVVPLLLLERSTLLRRNHGRPTRSKGCEVWASTRRIIATAQVYSKPGRREAVKGYPTTTWGSSLADEE